MPSHEIAPRWIHKNGIWTAPEPDEMAFFNPPGATDPGIFTSMGSTQGRLIDAEMHEERFRADFEWYFGRAPAVAVKEIQPPDVVSTWRIRVMAIERAGTPIVQIVALLVDWDEVEAMRTVGVDVTYCSFRRAAGDLGYNHKRLGLPDKFDAAPGGDCIVVNSRGELCEASYSNVFVMVDDIWVTPPLESPCLPGVGRRKLLQRGELQGHEVRVGNVGAEGFVPQQAFMSSSVRGIVPIRSWNGVELPLLNITEHQLP